MNNNKLVTVFVVILLLIGFSIRLIRWSNFDRFAGDEGIQVLTAEHLIKYQIFPDYGEVSALDSQNKYIIHKSSLGLYLSSIIYFLGLRTIKGYFFVSMLLNLFMIWLLYVTSYNIFGRKAGITVLILAVFSPLMIELSNWPSQPTNAIYLEIISLYLVSIFCHSRNEKLLIGSLVLSQAAAQIYPPYYLLLIPKIIFGFIFLKQIGVSKRFYIHLFFGSSLVYVPFLISDLRHNFYDSQTLISYLSSILNSKSDFSFFQFIVIFYKQLVGVFAGIITKFVHGVSISNKVIWIFFLSFLIKFIFSNFSDRKRSFLFALFWIIPVVLVTVIYSTEANPVTTKAYLTVLIPYSLLFSGFFFSKITRIVLVILVFIYFAFVAIPEFDALTATNGKPTVDEIFAASNQIFITHSNAKTVDPVKIFVISPGDSLSWDSTMYWYNLENISQKRLVNRSFYSGKYSILDRQLTKTVYLICHDIGPRLTVNECLNRFESNADKVFGRQYFLQSEVFKSKNIFVASTIKSE